MSTATTVPTGQTPVDRISRPRIAALILSLHHYGQLPMPLGWAQNQPGSRILTVDLETVADLNEWAGFLDLKPVTPTDRPDLGKRCASAYRPNWHGWHVQLYATDPLPEPPSQDAVQVIADVLDPQQHSFAAADLDNIPVTVLTIPAVAYVPTTEPIGLADLVGFFGEDRWRPLSHGQRRQLADACRIAGVDGDWHACWTHVMGAPARAVDAHELLDEADRMLTDDEVRECKPTLRLVGHELDPDASFSVPR